MKFILTFVVVCVELQVVYEHNQKKRFRTVNATLEKKMKDVWATFVCLTMLPLTGRRKSFVVSFFPKSSY